MAAKTRGPKRFGSHGVEPFVETPELVHPLGDLRKTAELELANTMPCNRTICKDAIGIVGGAAVPDVGE